MDKNPTTTPQKKNPARLLVNAESFGFGPSAAIASFFPHLREKFDYIAYVGTGHSLDLQRTLQENGQYYDAVYDISGENGAKRFEQIMSDHDIFVTALDFERATTARKLGKPTIIYDPLTWYWPSIPPIVKDDDTLYIAQDFHGVKERIAGEADKFAATKIVSPIVPEVTSARNPKYVLINLGGLKNPFWSDEQATEYARLVIETLKKVIPPENKIKILTSKKIAEDLHDLGAMTFNRDKMIDLFPKVKYAITTSGLGNIYDMAAYDIPTLFLPPSNDSQALQLELMKEKKTVDASIDWADIFRDEPIDYHQSQQAISEHITKAIEKIKTDPEARKRFEAKCALAVSKLQTLEHSATSKLIDEFGYGGAQQTAQAIIDFADEHDLKQQMQKVPEENIQHFQLAGGINLDFSSSNLSAMDEVQKMQLSAHIPGLRIVAKPHDKTNLRVRHIESAHTSLTQSRNDILLQDDWQGKIAPDCSHLLYGAARLNWLNNNMYPVHAACVGNDEDGYILLVGHSGVGKTSATLQSAISSGLKVFSGDKTLTSIDTDGTIKAIGGTHTMTIRAEDKRRWPSLEGQGITHGDRYIFDLKPEQYASQESVKIKAVVLMQINDGSTKCQKLSPTSALHTLYPYFLDTQRGDVLLAGGKVVLNGEPDSKVKTQLAQNLGTALQQAPTFYISGSLPRVTSMINSITRANTKELEDIQTKLGQGRTA